VKPARSFILGLGVCAILVVHSRAQSDKADVAAGKDVFEAQCIGCHNADSTEAKDGPGLKGVRNGKLPSGARATHDTVLEIIDKGREVMPSFKEALTSQQKEDVIAYVLTL
jgi:mono/diheme cytochrome c family protein